MISQYTVSAVIGYWRSGASIIEISGLTGLKRYEVRNIIYYYKMQKSNAEIQEKTSSN